MQTMRDALLEQIYQKMHDDERIFFLSADFGAPVLDKVRKKFSDRFINVGIAEQNLINIATGIALEGYTVYSYLIAPFVMRGYEQIRVNLSMSCQIRPLNVNIIGVGVGLSYGVSGPTHHCLEDISIMRLLPNFVVFSPSDSKLAADFVEYSINVKKPKYIRLDGKILPSIYQDNKEISLEKGFCQLARGENICLVSTGVMTHTALEVTKNLKKAGNNIGVIDVFILKPVNEDLLYASLKSYKYIITLEEALINNGGLDSLISNIILSRMDNIKIYKYGIKDKFVFDIGSREYLHKLNGIDMDSIIRQIIVINDG